jgi:hypothetical protein
LIGGIDTTPRVGDIVIACFGVSTTNAPTVTSSSGYTKAAQVRDTGVSNGITTAVFYKVLSAEETSITIAHGTSTSSDTTFVAHVWRYVDQANPLAATTTTAAGTSGTINPPAITTLVTNSVVIAAGAAAYATGVTPQSLTVPNGMQNFETINALNSATRTRLGVASLEITLATTYDPSSFGGGSSNVDSSSASITIALRPA